MGDTNILKIYKSIKLLVKIKNVSFILQKKSYRFSGQPNISIHLIYYNKYTKTLFSLGMKDPGALKYLTYGDVAESALKKWIQ